MTPTSSSTRSRPQRRAAPSRELLKLVELAVGRVVKVIMYADDSSGAIGDVARRLLETHEAARVMPVSPIRRRWRSG